MSEQRDLLRVMLLQVSTVIDSFDESKEENLEEYVTKYLYIMDAMTEIISKRKAQIFEILKKQKKLSK